tara:strand:+ start:316 stop:600 length:285 start_codon:yes stop_codon:yes gene_type:complete
MSLGQNVVFGISGNFAAKLVFHSKILPEVLDKSGMSSFFEIFASRFFSKVLPKSIKFPKICSKTPEFSKSNKNPPNRNLPDVKRLGPGFDPREI